MVGGLPVLQSNTKPAKYARQPFVCFALGTVHPPLCFRDSLGVPGWHKVGIVYQGWLVQVVSALLLLLRGWSDSGRPSCCVFLLLACS